MQIRAWKAACAVAVLALGGCVWAPGQHLDRRAFDGEGRSQDGHVQLVPITPKLIAQERAVESTGPVIPPALLAFRPAPYHIGPGDALYITVWDHPELTAPSGPQQQIYANGRLVRPDGTLYYPYVGKLQAAGKTLEEVRAYIAQRLAKYIEKPQVDVSVIQYDSQKVWLNGAFVQTGTQPITVTPLTLAQALGAAKIDPTNANLSDLTLSRDGVDYHLDLDRMRHNLQGADDIYLESGDHIYLGYNDRQQVYLMGEVSRPQALTFKTRDMSLSKALGTVGGLDPLTSKGKAVYVIRGVSDMEKAPATVYQLDAKSPTAFILADNFALQPGDVVFVGAAGITRWNRFLSQLLPLSSLVTNAASANKNLGN